VGTWYSSLANVDTGRRYLQTMVRISSDAGAQPTVTDMEFTFLSASVSPDNWEVDANGTFVLDNAVYRFGTKSGYLEATTSAATFIQPKRNTSEWDVSVIPGTSYIFSAYVWPTAQTLASLRTIKLKVYEGSGTSASFGAEVGSGSENYTTFVEQDGWYRLVYQFVAPGNWVKPVIEFGTGASAAALDAIYLDGAQVEEGNVVRSWTPGFVTQAVTVEGSGIAIDKQGGGVFRLRGSDTTGTRNIIELGDRGLDFGGTANPAQIYGAAEYQLTLDGHLRSLNGTTTSGAFYSSIDTDTVDRFAILADGKQEWGAGGSTARDTNLYRSEANVLKTDDNLIAGGYLQTGMAAKRYSNGGSVITTTSVGTGYSTIAGQEVTITPAYVGQKWIISYTAAVSTNTNTDQFIIYQVFVDGANLFFTRTVNIESGVNYTTNVSGMDVYTSVGTTPVDVTVGVRMGSSTGITVSTYYARLNAVPLPLDTGALASS
jgi:hypothetical protein